MYHLSACCNLYRIDSKPDMSPSRILEPIGLRAGVVIQEKNVTVEAVIVLKRGLNLLLWADLMTVITCA